LIQELLKKLIFEKVLTIYSLFSIFRIKTPHEQLEYISLLYSNKWRLVLYPFTADFIDLTKDIVDLSELGYPSRAMGMISDGDISLISRTRERHPFEFVLGFEAPVWTALFITMLLIPLSFSVIEKSFTGYFKNLWNYSYLILSEPIPKMPKSSMKRFVLTFWLLACTVLLSAYAGTLRNLFMRGNPDDVIDSWKDLYDRKHIKIFAAEGSAIYNFVQTNKETDEMARDFASRLEKFQMENLLYENFMMTVFKKLHSGYALSCPKFLIEDCNHYTAKLLKGQVNLCNKIHFLKYSSFSTP
jgi:hypothetical protein